MSSGFVAGTLLRTQRGLVSVDDLKKGDAVFTHENGYSFVKSVSRVSCGDIYTLKGYGFIRLDISGGMKVLAGNRQRNEFGDDICVNPQWLDIRDVKRGMFVAMPVIENPNQEQSYCLAENESIPVNEDGFWFFLGKYFDNGSMRPYNDNGGFITIDENRVIVSCTEKEAIELKNRVHGILDYTESINNGIHSICFTDSGLIPFIDRYNSINDGNFISHRSLSLPQEKLRAFLDGYFSSEKDTVNGGFLSTSTSSEKLIYNIESCINRAFGRPCAMYRYNSSVSMRKDGTQRRKPYYQIRFRKEAKERENAFFQDGIIWTSVKGIEHTSIKTSVYSVELSDDASLIAKNIAVKQG